MNHDDYRATGTTLTQESTEFTGIYTMMATLVTLAVMFAASILVLSSRATDEITSLAVDSNMLWAMFGLVAATALMVTRRISWHHHTA